MPYAPKRHFAEQLDAAPWSMKVSAHHADRRDFSVATVQTLTHAAIPGSGRSWLRRF